MSNTWLWEVGNMITAWSKLSQFLEFLSCASLILMGRLCSLATQAALIWNKKSMSSSNPRVKLPKKKLPKEFLKNKLCKFWRVLAIKNNLKNFSAKLSLFQRRLRSSAQLRRETLYISRKFKFMLTLRTSIFLRNTKNTSHHARALSLLEKPLPMWKCQRFLNTAPTVKGPWNTHCIGASGQRSKMISDAVRAWRKRSIKRSFTTIKTLFFWCRKWRTFQLLIWATTFNRLQSPMRLTDLDATVVGIVRHRWAKLGTCAEAAVANPTTEETSLTYARIAWPSISRAISMSSRSSSLMDTRATILLCAFCTAQATITNSDHLHANE